MLFTGPLQDRLSQGDHVGHGEPDTLVAQSVNGPRPIQFMNHDHGALAAILSTPGAP